MYRQYYSCILVNIGPCSVMSAMQVYFWGFDCAVSARYRFEVRDTARQVFKLLDEEHVAWWPDYGSLLAVERNV